MGRNSLVIKQNWKIYSLVMMRVIAGMMMAYHGLDIFDPKLMAEYPEWESIKHLPFPVVFVYVGKGLELLMGLFLAIGLFTRVSSLLIAIVMLFITFKVGKGAFWYEDQHPFVFALLAIVFVIIGPVAFSIDQVLFKSKRI